MASFMPAACSPWAMDHAIERLLATPKTTAFRPCRSEDMDAPSERERITDHLLAGCCQRVLRGLVVRRQLHRFLPLGYRHILFPLLLVNLTEAPMGIGPGWIALFRPACKIFLEVAFGFVQTLSTEQVRSRHAKAAGQVVGIHFNRVFEERRCFGVFFFLKIDKSELHICPGPLGVCR